MRTSASCPDQCRCCICPRLPHPPPAPVSSLHIVCCPSHDVRAPSTRAESATSSGPSVPAVQPARRVVMRQHGATPLSTLEFIAQARRGCSCSTRGTTTTPTRTWPTSCPAPASSASPSSPGSSTRRRGFGPQDWPASLAPARHARDRTCAAAHVQASRQSAGPTQPNGDCKSARCRRSSAQKETKRLDIQMF